MCPSNTTVKDTDFASFMAIEDIFDFNLFPGAKIIGGYGGIKNRTNLMVILETPNGMNWLNGQEIVLTSGYALINYEKQRNSLITIAKEKNVAAVCVKEGRYFGEINSDLIKQADAMDIPLITLPQSCKYSNMMKAFYNHLYAIHTRDLITQNHLFYELLLMQNEEKSIASVIDKLEEIANCKIDLINHYKEENILLDFDKVEKKPTRQSKNGKMFTRFVIHANEVLAYLDVYNQKSLSVFQIRTINYGMSVIKSKLLSDQNRQWSKSELHKALGLILLNSSQEINKKFIPNIVDIMGWDQGPYFTIIFKYTDKGIKLNSNDKHKLNINIRKFLEGYDFNDFIFVENEDEMIIFANSTAEEIQKTFHRLFQNTRELAGTVKIGCSSPHSDLLHIHKQLQQAKIAYYCTNTFEMYDNLGDERFLNLPLEDDIYQELFRKTVGKLISYDKENDAKLLITLKEFFKSNMNRKETASQLFIHPETLRYRLAKVEELTGYSPYKTSGIFILITALNVAKLLDD